MKQHVWFEPLPWQPPTDITHCGRGDSPELGAVRLDDFLEILDAIPGGRRRIVVDPSGVMPGFCSICAVVASTAVDFAEDPNRRLRAVADQTFGKPARRVTLDAELLALADLAAAHPDEFAALRDRHHAFLLLQRGWSP